MSVVKVFYIFHSVILPDNAVVAYIVFCALQNEYPVLYYIIEEQSQNICFLTDI